MDYMWKKSWNQDVYKGLFLKYARKGLSRMSPGQKQLLREKLNRGEYTRSQVGDIISD